MRSTGTLDSLGTLSGSIWQSDLLGVCVACESKVLNFRAMTLRKSLRFPAVTCTLLVSLEEYRIISFLCDAVQLVPAVNCLVAVSLEDYKTIGFFWEKRPAVTCSVSLSPEKYSFIDIFWEMTWVKSLRIAKKEKTTEVLRTLQFTGSDVLQISVEYFSDSMHLCGVLYM